MTLLERYHVDPEAIERRSFAIARQLLPGLEGTAEEQLVKLRLVYASGDPDLVPRIVLHPGAVAVGVAALRGGAAILTDVRMVAVGISRSHAARLGATVACTLDHPEVQSRARAEGTTRAVAGVRLAAARVDGAIVAIGNAPTALLALLDLVDAGACRPTLVVGMPVGFVNAAEAKEELIRRDVPFVTLRGRRGGSTLAAAAVNALLRIATTSDDNGVDG